MKKNSSNPLPPLILAIETATMCGSVALVSHNHCLAEYSVDTATTHSRRLIHQVEQVMRETGTVWGQIDGIAVSLGPGSFTGLRIGLSTAKGLATGADRPLLGVSTLEGLACQVVAPPRQQICAVLDARKKEVYTALYRCDNRGIPEKTSEDMVMNPGNLADLIDEPTLFIGDGGVVYGDFFRDKLGNLTIFAPPRIFFPRAAAIGLLGAKMYAANDFVDPASAVPIYVRPSEAELTIQK